MDAKRKIKKGEDISGKFQIIAHMKTAYEALDTIIAENVLGYIPGSDKKEECVVITAHYDHLGKSGGKIYNGAYDNAAGVAAVLEIAEAFAMASEGGYSPIRSPLFLTQDAEEMGGVGTIYFLDHPVFPLSDTVVDINIDGIGQCFFRTRNDPSYRSGDRATHRPSSADGYSQKDQIQRCSKNSAAGLCLGLGNSQQRKCCPKDYIRIG